MKRLLLLWAASTALVAVATVEMAPRLYGNLLQAPTGAVATQSAWSPTDKDANIAVSTTTFANDTATQGSVSGFKGVRGTLSHPCCSAANKWVFTIKIQAADAGGGWLGGVADGAGPLSGAGGGYPGSFSHGYGVEAQTTATTGVTDFIDGAASTAGVLQCSQTTGGVARFTPGTTLWLAMDFGTGHVFCSGDCTTWANSGSPAGDTGFSATLTAATYFPMFGGADAGGVADIAILNTKPTLTGCSNLTGFAVWG